MKILVCVCVCVCRNAFECQSKAGMARTEFVHVVITRPVIYRYGPGRD
jgi:hypothetical protein